ncbi:RNA methyltransferase tRNA(m5U54)methyltransferase [Mycoblastus sanguinarius]|nr:RNA methyltransferase tRNA(m5U54)methyltransferase [Mycoblastus sanguinarius]
MGSSPPSDQATSTSTTTRELSEVTYHGKTFDIVKEGSAEILNLQRPKVSSSRKSEASAPQSVFYNPIQQYNRDLSVLAIRAFGDDFAAVRSAKHQRRAEQVARGGQRGKKRKRGIDEGADTEAGAIAEKEKDVGDDVAVNGKRGAPKAHVEDAPTSKEPSIPTTNGQESHENGQKPAEGGGPNAENPIKGQTPDHSAKNPSDPPTAHPSFRILDALSATGLRALRYAKEIPTVTSITANDLSSSATASIKLNAEHNKLSNKINATTGDAIEHMHRARSRAEGGAGHYHVIDLDPYGTAAPFLDAAVQAIVDGGLLCVTCTDAGVFASLGYLEKTYSQYGGLPLKGAHAHEGGLRLILHAIATSAARYGLAIEPLLSLSIDFYARVFVRVHRSPAEVKFLASKTMIVYNCDAGCGAWTIQHLARTREKKAKNGDTFYTFTCGQGPSASPECEHCGFKTHHAGPMWGGPLHNSHFIQRTLDMLPSLDKETYGTIPRIEGMLSIALNETLEDPPHHNCNTCPDPGSKSKSIIPDRPIPPTNPAARANHPFFFLPSALSRIIHCVSPSDAAIRGALLNLGYRSTRSHTKAGSICTDAPWSVIWEIMREWVRQKSPIKEDAIKKGTAGWGIMQKDRRNIRVMEARKDLRNAVENTDVKDCGGLRKEVEAALYRLGKATDAQSADITVDESEVGGAEVPNHNTQSEQNTSEQPQQEIPEQTAEKREGKHPSKLHIVFDEERGREPQGKRMVRYQTNPRPDWGPMNKAKGDL